MSKLDPIGYFSQEGVASLGSAEVLFPKLNVELWTADGQTCVSVLLAAQITGKRLTDR